MDAECASSKRAEAGWQNPEGNENLKIGFRKELKHYWKIHTSNEQDVNAMPWVKYEIIR